MSGIMRGGNYTVQSTQYLAQSAHAAEWLRKDWRRMLDEGYTEVAPGILRSPDGKTEVSL